MVSVTYDIHEMLGHRVMLASSCYNITMRPNEYFIQVANSATPAEQVLASTGKLLEDVAGHFSALDELELNYIAQRARRHSERAQDSGNESLFNLFGIIADYTHLLISELNNFTEEDDSISSDGKGGRLDPIMVKPVLIAILTDELAKRLSSELGFGIEEAKVYMSLTEKFKIDFDYFF